MNPIPYLRFLSIVSLSISTLPSASAQSARDSTAADTTSFFHWVKYRFTGDGNLSRGNVNRTLLVLRAEINYSRPVVSVSTHPRFAFGEQNGQLAEREPFTDLFIDLYKQHKVYGFGLGTVEASNLRDIIFRKLAGAGVGFRLIETKRQSLVLTNAIIQETTNFRRRPDINVWRNSARLRGKHTLFNEGFQLTHTTFVQPALNQANLRWNTIVSLELPLNARVTLRTSFENAYESAVETGRRNNDTRLTFGISVGNMN